jgi:hypothetical protein
VRLVLVSTHEPLQSISGHVSTQLVSTQNNASPQEAPHAPQFATSLRRSTHDAPHASKPLRQVHAPATHA